MATMSWTAARKVKISQPLVEWTKFYYFNHIKLWSVKQFAKVVDQGGEQFLVFPKLSDAKIIKVDKFVGSQINAMLKSEKLEREMTNVEREA